jgi:hypothetical protein
MTLFAADPVYRRFLAQHAGLWAEVGVFDDARLLARLRRERRRAGLPADRWTPPDLSHRSAGHPGQKLDLASPPSHQKRICK